MKSIIVGFGRIANSIRLDRKISRTFKYASHAQVLEEHPKFKWIGVVDPSETAQKDALVWGIRPGTLEDFEESEFAVLAIPPGARLETIGKLPNLKAILTEKPMGAEGGLMLEYCDEMGIDVSVNYWRRGVEYYQDLANGGLKRRVGTPQVVFCTYGNGLFNNGSHLVDFIQMLFGEVDSTSTVGKPQTLKSLGCSGPMDDYSATFVMEMASGFNVHVAPIDFNKYREVGVDIWGDKGRLFLCQESLRAYHYPMATHRSMEKQKEIASDMFGVELPNVRHAFYNLYTSIAEGKSLSSGESAVLTQEILEGIIS